MPLDYIREHGYVIVQQAFPQIPYLDIVKQHLLGVNNMNKQFFWRIAKYLGIGFFVAFIALILIVGVSSFIMYLKHQNFRKAN